MNKGLYIALVGGEGSGKSSQRDLLVEQLRKQFGEDSVVVTREPGGTPYAEKLRQAVLNTPEEKIDPIAEAYGFAAPRAQSLRKIVWPALSEGKNVVTDRCVFDSVAYQGFGRGLGFEMVWEINKIAVGEITPDIVFLINLDPEIGLERKRINNCVHDEIDKEKLEFHRKVREGYLFLAKKFPEIFRVIDGALSKEEIAELVWTEVQAQLKNRETNA
jgi:dTMP kinase